MANTWEGGGGEGRLPSKGILFQWDKETHLIAVPGNS